VNGIETLRSSFPVVLVRQPAMPLLHSRLFVFALAFSFTLTGGSRLQLNRIWTILDVHELDF
jgi:hypothetical protein